MKHLEVRHNRQNIKLLQRDIIRIEAYGSYIKIFLTRRRLYVVFHRLQATFRKLNKNSFFLIHRSHIINIDHIKTYPNRQPYSILMFESDPLTIADRRLKPFSEFLEIYWKQKKARSLKKSLPFNPVFVTLIFK